MRALFLMIFGLLGLSAAAYAIEPSGLMLPGFAPAGQSVETLPGWQQERVADAIAPFVQACPHLHAEYRQACAEARLLRAGDEAGARAFVVRHFRASALGVGLYTGYFELEVPGSRTRGGPFQFPLLRVPRNPRQYDRVSIEHGALAGENLELVWLSSMADVFFMQLQGSGRVRLPDGGVMRVGYAAGNGRAPVPTDALFRGAGLPNNDLSIPGLRAWIAAHPDQGVARLDADPSFVFFRETTGNPESHGHVGALGTPLVPMRSIAVDPRYVDLGSPVWLDTTDSFTGRRFQRLMLASDTGDGIHGQARADIFYGWDRRAEIQGGHMYSKGQAWVLRPVGGGMFAGLP